MTNNDTDTDDARSQTPDTNIVSNRVLFFPGQVIATPDSIGDSPDGCRTTGNFERPARRA